jgi:hypothetical protein
MTKLNSLESQRATLTERLRLIEAESNVVRLHPNAIKTYCRNMEKLHAALTSGGKLTPENRAAFRTVFDTIIVHETAKWKPYQFTPYARIASILGIDMMPAKRPAEQILAESGVVLRDSAAQEKARAAPSRSLPQSVLCLGRWQNRAA